MVPARIEQLQDLSPEQVEYFLEHRDSPDIPDAMKKYILQLDTVARITHQNKLSVRDACKQLQREWPELTPSQARTIYYDALAYFYLDDSLSCRAWDNIYAEKFEDLSRLAIAANKLDVAYKCSVKAHELRTKERESKDIDWRAPVFVMNINVRPEDLGFKSQKLADIARRNEDEKFREMIVNLPASDAEKKRILLDAGIATDPVPLTKEADYDEQ